MGVSHGDPGGSEGGLAPGHAFAETVEASAAALLGILWKLLS